MVTCVAKSKSGSQEVGTRSNPDLMEGKMFRGEGENGLTLRKHLVFFYLSSLFQLFEWRFGSCLFFFASFFFKEDDPYSMRIELLEGSISWIDRLRWIGSLWRFWVLL